MGGVLPVRFAGLTLVLTCLLLVVPNGFATSVDQDDIQVILDGLQGLDFDDFVDESFRAILVRSPEAVISMGLSQELGTGEARLDNICSDYVDETYQLKAGVQAILQSYDRSQLDRDQQIAFDSYSWLLGSWSDEHEFMYHFYPVTHGLSRQNLLMMFFTDEHPLESLRDAEDYISRLEQVDDQFACLIENLDQSQARGIVAPAQMLQWAADRLRGIVPGSATDLPFYIALAAQIESISELSPAQRQDLRDRAEQAIESSVIPAYQSLVARLDQQIPLAPEMNGVWQLPDGDRFYDHRLSHHTTTDFTADQLHQMGLDEVDRVRALIRGAFDALGYPPDQGFTELYARVAQESGIITADQIIPYTEALITQAQEDIEEAFDIAPQTPVIVVGGRAEGYLRGSLDGSRPGIMYVNNQTDIYRYSVRTLTYHETFPGHHFQYSIGNEQDVPLFAKAGIIYVGFVEGWATYAENLVEELGWYDDDVYSDLGRLQWELLRAARLVVDTGLHARHWSYQRAIDYYVDAVGTTTDLATREVNLHLYYIAYYTCYKVGMMKILELREDARDRLGELFDIKAFHRVVLLHHRLPLTLLERLVDDYVELTLATHRPPRRPAGRRRTTARP